MIRCVPREATAAEDAANIQRFADWVRSEDQEKARIIDAQWRAVHPPERKSDPAGWLAWFAEWMNG